MRPVFTEQNGGRLQFLTKAPQFPITLTALTGTSRFLLCLTSVTVTVEEECRQKMTDCL